MSTIDSTPPADGAGLKVVSSTPLAASRAARPDRALPDIEVKNPPAKSRVPSAEVTRVITEPTVTTAAAPVPAVVAVPAPGSKPRIGSPV